MSERTLAELEQELFKVVQEHAERCKEVSVARNRECDALNRLNALQKAIDAKLDEWRKSAPRDSDWKSNERRGIPA